MFRRWPWPKLIGIFFATVWGVIGSLALSRPWWAPAIAASLATSMALLIGVGRNKATQSGLFQRDAYRIAVGAELAAIAVVQVILSKLGLLSFSLSAIGVIVGLHFIGLWKASSSKKFLFIAFGMCVVSLTSMALPSPPTGTRPREVAVGLGNALILWAGASL